MASIGDDCHWFYTSQCRKGDVCPFRHVEEALGSEVVCPAWLQDGCYLPHCPYRHAHIEVGANPWPQYGFPQPGPVPTIRSSLVSIPIVGGVEAESASAEAYARSQDERYYQECAAPDLDDLAPHELAPGVLITPRHDLLLPPAVKPVVVRIGPNRDSSDSEDSVEDNRNLTTVRRVDHSPQHDNDVEECGRVVVEKEKLTDDVEELAPARQVESAALSPERRVESGGKVPPERTAVVRDHDHEDHSEPEEATAEEEVTAVSGEEEEEEVEDEEGGEEEAEEESEEESGSQSADSQSDCVSSVSGAPRAESGPEPELDLFDEDDTAILGVVERTPVSLRHKPARQDSREQRRDKRERRDERRRSRSPRSPRSLPDSRRERRPDNSPRRRRNDLVATKPTENKEKNDVENKKNAEEKDGPVEVLSLEEIMRQKALESMIERRKQKEAAQKAKTEGADQESTEAPKSAPAPGAATSQTPRSPRRPERARRSPPRERPLRPRSKSPLARRRSPPVNRWRPLGDRGRRDARLPYDDSFPERRRRFGDPGYPDYPEYPEYPEYPDYPARASEARQLSLLQAQTQLMDKMTKLAASSSSFIAEKDLKRQQKRLKKELKQLSRSLARGSSSSRSRSRSASPCSTCSDSTTSSHSRSRRKHKNKKSKRKKTKKSRKRSPEKVEESPVEEAENGIESDYVEYESESPQKEKSVTPKESPVKSDDGDEIDIVITPPKVMPLPRAKVVVKLDEGSKALNISGSELLGEQEVREKVSEAQRRVLVSRAERGQKQDEEAKIRGAIASRIAAKKADDEAAKMMLQKIRDNAKKESRKVVIASSVEVKSEAGERTESVKPGRTIRLGRANTGRVTPPLGFADVTEDDGSKRRIIRRQPTQVYVPPAAKRKADGDVPETTDVRTRLEQMKSNAKTLTRSLTPEPRVLGVEALSRRATVAEIRAKAGQTAQPAEPSETTKFELGVKTFAEIMREKKERKAREQEEKRKMADAPDQPAAARPSDPPAFIRPSVLDRLGQQEPTPKPAGGRPLQRYEDDWLADPPSPAEGLLRDNKRRPAPAQNPLKPARPIKRARTEPSRTLHTAPPKQSKSEQILKTKTLPMDRNQKPKSETLVSVRKEKRTEETVSSKTKEDLEEELLLMEDSFHTVEEPETTKPAVEKINITEPEPQAPATKPLESIKKPSWTDVEEIDLLLADVTGDTTADVTPDVTPKPPHRPDDDDDDDALLLELDELLA